MKKHKVRYLVIGGIAAVLYGVPRATFDLDILIDATPKNVKKMLDAFLEAGLYTASLTSIDEILATEITIFKDLVRIDVQTKTPGLEFKKAWKNKITMQYKMVDFQVVSKNDLIISKVAAGRKKDLEDVQLLQMEE
ncbi:MAG: DUF6036 family nucleotidyltransferase [Acidobacteria bacterium]|nr:DUF6036 family nucleotidyltransferase [Acidobacteriota bacterium]